MKTGFGRLSQVIQYTTTLRELVCCIHWVDSRTTTRFTPCFVVVPVQCLDLAHPQEMLTVCLRASFGCIHCHHLPHCFHHVIRVLAH